MKSRNGKIKPESIKNGTVFHVITHDFEEVVSLKSTLNMKVVNPGDFMWFEKLNTGYDLRLHLMVNLWDDHTRNHIFKSYEQTERYRQRFQCMVQPFNYPLGHHRIDTPVEDSMPEITESEMYLYSQANSDIFSFTS